MFNRNFQEQQNKTHKHTHEHIYFFQEREKNTKRLQHSRLNRRFSFFRRRFQLNEVSCAYVNGFNKIEKKASRIQRKKPQPKPNHDHHC